jgi:pyridoxamine 5'-phosphate oxidase
MYPYPAPHPEPFTLFKSWYDRATKEGGMKDPTVMHLATADAEGRPSGRIVLLKQYDEQGFCFFTNMTSRKGANIKENPYGALTFYWEKLGLQIRIEGKIEKVSAKESDDYFTKRERGSQIGAWASKQSAPMQEDEELPARVKSIVTEFEAAPIPRPPFWGGYRLVPDYFEFWEDGEHRLHKRICYTAEAAGWSVGRVYP